MAVIEIAKIQVRRGQENQTGIPALAGGEFAWAADTERLFIGLRRDDGGSRDANVEILTENHLKNFFQVSFTTSTYTYRDGSASSTLGISGITAENGTNDEIVRTIQAKLDDIVNVQDFGVYGNGSDWDLRRLQLTIDRLFLNTGRYNVDPAKKLYFPAGTYYITGTVYIPAYTNIIGDGVGKTVFVLTTNTSAMFKTMDTRSTNGTSGAITFDSGGFVSTGTAKFVQMSDLTLKYGSAATVTEAMSLLSLDCADNSLIKNVEFKGNHTTGTGVSTTSGYVGLNLRGKTINGTHANSIIDNCSFDGLYSGVISNHDIKAITIQNSEFNTLVRGVTFNNPKDGTALVGPTFIKIANNRFDLVEQEAIYVGSNASNTGSFVISQNNFFERVGTYYSDWGDIGTTATAVITFLSDQNSSVNDHFRRALVHKQYINTSLTTYYRPLVDGRTTLDEVFVTTATIYPGNTATVFLRLPVTGNSQHLNVKYSAFKQNAGASTGTVSTGTIGGTSVSLVDVTGIEVNSTVEISVASTVTSVIPVDTIIDAIDLNTNVITFSNTVTLAATDILVFTSQLDRMGNLGVYLQDSTSPNVLVTDDYNYINSDGGLVFSVSVNTTGTYYEISASLNTTVVAAPIVLEFQNKLMI